MKKRQKRLLTILFMEYHYLASRFCDEPSHPILFILFSQEMALVPVI